MNPKWAAAGNTAGQAMTTPVVTVDSDASVAHIAEILTTKRISAVFVVDSRNAVLGLVSERDVLSREGALAKDIMTTSIISVTVDTELEQVRRLLVDSPIRRLPVMQDGRLAGVISRHDLVGRMVEWACGVCGETIRGSRPPDACPKCGGSGDRFVLQEQSPGP